MQTSYFTRKSLVILGLMILPGTFSIETGFAQPPRRGDRSSRGRDDATNLLNVVRNREMAEKLKLTPEQEKQLGEIRSESFRGFRGGMNPDDFEKAKKESEEKALTVLNAEQKIAWQKMKEDALAAASKQDSSPQGPPSGGVVRAENTAVVGRGSIPDDKPPEGERAVVSFGPVAATTVALKVQKDEAEEDKGETKPYDVTADDTANL